LFNVSKGATGYDAVIRNGGTMNIYAGGVVSGANVSKGGAVNINASGAMYLSGTNVASNIKVLTSGALLVSSGAVARDVAVSGTVAGNGNSPFWSLDVKGGAVDGGSAIGYNNVIYGVFLRAIDGGKISDFTITANGAAGDARAWAMIGFNNCVAGSGANLTVESRARLDARNGGVISGATIRNGGFAVAWGGKITDAVVSGAGAGASARLSAASMGTSIGSIERAAIYGGGYLEAGASAWVDTVDIYSGGSMKLVNDYASAADITVHSGGLLWTYVNGAINNLTVSAGGTWNCDWNAYATAITGTVTLDLTGAAGLATAMAARHFNGAGDVRVVKASEIVGNYSYQLLASGGHQVNLFTLAIGGGNDYETRNGTADIIDPFRKMSYSRVSSGYDVSGTTVYDLKLVTAVDPSRQIAAVDSAAALATSGSTLNGSDREARWTANTTYGDTVYAAQGMTTGNAWLEIDGATVGTALYGAAANQNFTGAVNMKLTSGSIRNLAAGAANGGTVANVNFTMAGGTLAGAAYAGGFGNVTETIKTTITDGTLAEGKDFYAGALANYAKTNTATSVGNISLTIAGGTFGGNIYGASAVKASVANAHTAGNVTLSITGGETAKGDQACIFAGGYATGSATATKVYTVGDIDATVSGGSWGEAGNGRGFFGGAFASGVTAEAQDVTITIDGGSIGNVFGGGWAQKGGTSIVDDVEIVITGGTVTNVFGGGAHSTSGGATTVDDVEITISGGSITGSIYAMGQSDGDAVVGDEVSVTFTGANDFGCNVYGYSYVGGEVNDATLSYTDYAGTFSGEIGGFASITLDGGTAMTLATDADNVSNGAWEFDFTDRASLLAGTSLLTWSTADFENDTIKVRFADETQAKAGWNIATVAEAFSGTTFDLTVGETEITGLAYNQQIASGDYAGWGFDLESGVLKFKQLA